VNLDFFTKHCKTSSIALEPRKTKAFGSETSTKIKTVMIIGLNISSKILFSSFRETRIQFECVGTNANACKNHNLMNGVNIATIKIVIDIGISEVSIM